LVLLSLLSGCAFSPSGGSAGDDDGSLDDGAIATEDAITSPDALAASIDAAACPDTDGDGLCNASDPWPCGATAPTISQVVMTGSDVWGAISAVSIAGGGNTAVAQPGQALTYTLAWGLRDRDIFCPTCQDQIEVGLVAGGRHTCVYDGRPPNDQLTTGVAAVNMTAPTTAGVYQLRFQIARDLFGCNAFGRTGWWIGEPGADKTFGVLCVP
jgi:hypothetical protein